MTKMLRKNNIKSNSRRDFIKVSSLTSVGLLVGLNTKGALAVISQDELEGLEVTPLVRIERNGTVTVISKAFEMGQGVTTGFTTLVAEEMNANYETMRYEFAPVNTEKYINKGLGAQGTGGSLSIRGGGFLDYRKAGAAAREIIVKAAADKWSVSEDSVRIDNGIVSAGSNKAHFGELIALARKYQITKEPKLKNIDEFQYIGNEKLNRKDNFDKTTGRAVYALDVQIPGMVYVSICRSPKFGGKLKSFSSSEAEKVNGFISAKALPNGSGVAVFGNNTWAVLQAKKKIVARWDETDAETRSTDQLVSEHKKLLEQPTYEVNKQYSTSEAVEDIKKTETFVEADFLLPFLAHAPMEPVNCVIEPTRNGGIRLHDGCQIPTITQGALANVLKLKPEQIEIKTYYAGGSFGRRITPTSDYHVDAALAFDLLGRETPVKLMFTREDDIKGGWYRPMHLQRAKIGLDKTGNIVAWDHRSSCKSIAKGTFLEKMFVKDGVDHWSVENISDTLYGIENLAIGHSDFLSPIPVLWWRAVGHTQNVFTMETLIDMVAARAGRDPIDYRLDLLKSGTKREHERFANVMRVVRDFSGWEKGQRRGFAASYTFGTFLAVVADVSVSEKEVHIDRMFVAVDCGTAINPDVIKAQIEGGIGYGLSAAIYSELNFENGVVMESNFPNYETLRINQMPKIDVKIVSSAEAPGGIGEPGTPIAAPALINALYAKTGQRITTLPISKSGFVFV